MVITIVVTTLTRPTVLALMISSVAKMDLALVNILDAILILIVLMRQMKWTAQDPIVHGIPYFGTLNKSLLIVHTRQHAFIQTGYVMVRMIVGMVLMRKIVRLKQVKPNVQLIRSNVVMDNVFPGPGYVTATMIVMT